MILHIIVSLITFISLYSNTKSLDSKTLDLRIEGIEPNAGPTYGKIS